MMKVSVILLSWNRKDEIFKTLSDLKEQTFKDFEIIVIDQGSTDGVQEMIRRQFPEVRMIELGKNVGVPGGRNRGVREARGEILVFLDNDASFEKHALELTWDRFGKDPGLGIIGYKILNGQGTDLDLSSWVYQKSRIRDADTEFETYTFCGAGHAIRGEVFEKAGTYSEEFFFAFEEVELGLKAIRSGYRIIYYPSVQVFHRVSQEKRFHNPKKFQYGVRNLLWIIWRYYPRGPAIGRTVTTLGAYLLKGARGRYFWAVLSGTLEAFGKIHYLSTSRERMDRRTWRTYKKLSYKGTATQVLRDIRKFG